MADDEKITLIRLKELMVNGDMSLHKMITELEKKVDDIKKLEIEYYDEKAFFSVHEKEILQMKKELASLRDKVEGIFKSIHGINDGEKDAYNDLEQQIANSADSTPSKCVFTDNFGKCNHRKCALVDCINPSTCKFYMDRFWEPKEPPEVLMDSSGYELIEVKKADLEWLLIACKHVESIDYRIVDKLREKYFAEEGDDKD